MNMQEEIAARIKRARKSAGLTQGKLAANIGVSASTVRRWETKKRTPSYDDLCRVVEACGISAAYLSLRETQGDGVLTLDAYQQAAARTISRDLMPSEIETHALHGMVAEIGELHGLYQKVYQGHQADDVHLKKELGDLLWFIAEYCTACDWSLAEVAQMNIDKLKRRYPDGFDAEHSLHRKEGDI